MQTNSFDWEAIRVRVSLIGSGKVNDKQEQVKRKFQLRIAQQEEADAEMTRIMRLSKQSGIMITSKGKEHRYPQIRPMVPEPCFPFDSYADGTLIIDPIPYPENYSYIYPNQFRA